MKAWWEVIAPILSPWALLYLVWQFGVHFAVLYLAAVYVLSVMVVVGIELWRAGRRP